MLVSVIVPLYNKQKYVVRALDSITRQTFSEIEVIVIDDGSTDGGAEVACAYGDPRVRVLRQANAGPGAARNRGLTEAKGDLIAFLDADDEWMPAYLESCVRAFEELGPEVATVTFGYVDFPEEQSREPMWRKRGLTDGVFRVSASTSPLQLVHMLAYMWNCSTVARAPTVRQYGGFYAKNRSTFGEDAVLWLKVLLNETVCFQMKPLTCFHREASALSGNYRAARPIEAFLLDPEDVAAFSPPELLPLLRAFYAVRACKTAAVLGYWGQWNSSRLLFRKFVELRDWRLPFFLPALIGCTPVAGIVGRALESVRNASR